MTAASRDRFVGCIIGQCLGDALGFPMEGYPTGACQRYVRDFLGVNGPVLTSRTGYPIGQYTDDSQLARELLQSYASRGSFEPEDYATRIAAIFQENRIVGRGHATDRAARRLASGVPWQEAGTPYPSAGNGSAMRAAPIGLLFYDQSDDLILAAHDQGRITHTDPRCSAGSVAIAGCVALALTRELNTEEWLKQLAEWVAVYDKDFGRYILKLHEWLLLSPRDAVGPISKCGIEPGYRDSWQGISPFVIGSVLWSLYAFFRNTGDYMDTIRTSIAVGGDVDSTAAMAGAISGAYLGNQDLPNELTRLINDRGTWGYSALVNLAGQVYQLVHSDDL